MHWTWSWEMIWNGWRRLGNYNTLLYSYFYMVIWGFCREFKFMDMEKQLSCTFDLYFLWLHTSGPLLVLTTCGHTIYWKARNNASYNYCTQDTLQLGLLYLWDEGWVSAFSLMLLLGSQGEPSGTHGVTLRIFSTYWSYSKQVFLKAMQMQQITWLMFGILLENNYHPQYNQTFRG